MTGFLSKLFSKKEPSRQVARQRLQFLLLHDRVNLTPVQMDAIKREILAVIAKYVEVDPEKIGIELKRAHDTGVSLVSNIPLKRVVAKEPGRALGV